MDLAPTTTATAGVGKQPRDSTPTRLVETLSTPTQSGKTILGFGATPERISSDLSLKQREQLLLCEGLRENWSYYEAMLARESGMSKAMAQPVREFG